MNGFKDNTMKGKDLLYNMYNATSTEHPIGSDELETYEHWLERQLMERIRRIDDAKRVLKEGHKILNDGYVLQKIAVDEGNNLRQVLDTATLTLDNMNGIFD